MKHEMFRPGDLVEVVTVNRASGGATTNRRSKPAHNERWRAFVIGPSVLGTGWWIVKRLNGGRSNGRTYTIPEAEVIRVRRPS